MGDGKAVLPNDVIRAINDLRDKFKHGHHIIKILESQLETARQNISLLQGQVRLANETIENLKQQFNEADMTLSYMTNNYKGNHEKRSDSNRHMGRDSDDYSQAPIFVARNDEHENQRRLAEFEKNSPKCLSKSNDMVMGDNDQPERGKSPMQHGQERPKSPYAQQLRQVLDALQDEDPRKSHPQITQESTGVSSHNQPQVCMCAECVPSSTGHRHFQTDALTRRSSCGCEYSGNEMHYHEECSKHKSMLRTNEESSVGNRPNSRHIPRHDNPTTAHISNVSHSSHHVDYSSQCTGPCCSSIDLSKGYKIVEKSPGMPHYIAPRSPRRQKQHETRHDPHCHQMVSHCEDDKCRCHPYVSYAGFGYQVVESSPGVPQPIPPISPSLLSKKNKRYMPLAPGDEPPHLKYTKVKRIDGSKVAAQKTIQDFSKRRLQPYNPRWDLDLLIVPPPMPASELFTVLGLEQESNFQQARDHDASLSSDNMALESKSLDSSIIKSKVINSGGTVIVLTESDQQARPSHSVTSMARSEFPTKSLLNEASFSAEQARSPPHDFKIEKKPEEDVNPEADGTSAGHSEYQSVGSSVVGSAEQSTHFVMGIHSQPPTSPSSTRNSAASPVGSLQNLSLQDSGHRGNLPLKISVKTERNNNNNNSLAKRTISNSIPSTEEDGDEHPETVVVDASNNLSVRYDNVLYQKSQDFGRISNEEEYIIHNRAKGKVH